MMIQREGESEVEMAFLIHLRLYLNKQKLSILI